MLFYIVPASADTAAAPTTTAAASSENPSFTGDAIIFTATVRNLNDNSLVTVGAVTFTEGAAILAGPIALNSGGQAGFTASSLTEGSHAITASYDGSPGAFDASSGSVAQQVDNHTVVNGASFCNPGAITIPSPPATGNDLPASPSDPYPSRIFVSGLPSTINTVTVTLNNFSHQFPDDVDILLAGPTGGSLVLFSDAGGSTPVSNITLTLDDAAASLLLDSGPLVAGAFKPTAVNSGSQMDNFPSPAPGGPYAFAAPFGSATLGSAFNGTNPNGAWTLYVVDGKLGDTGGIDGGWCLNFTLNPDLKISVDDSTFTAVPGDPITYTIVVSNDGGADVNGAAVTDAFPLALNAVTYTAVSTGGAVGAANGSGDINQTVDLPAGSSITYTVNATVAFDAVGSLVNTAHITVPPGDPTPQNNSATDTDAVSPRVDFNVTVTGSSDSVIAGSGAGNLTYVVTVSNFGPVAATGLVLSDALIFPSGVSLDSILSSAGTSFSNGIWTVGNMAVGGIATLTITLTVGPSAAAAANVISNTAAVTASNEIRVKPGDDFDSDAATVVTQASLSVTMSADAAVEITENVTYDITVSNTGPSDAHTVTLIDSMPPEITFISQNQSSGPAFTLNSNGNDVTNTIATLAAGASARFSIAAQLDPGVELGTAINNTANVSDNTPDPVSDDNSFTAHTMVINSPPILSSSSAIPNPAKVGQLIVFAAAAADANNDPLSYTWNFDDGATANTPSTTHAFATAGSHTAALTVADGRGGLAAASITVAVIAAQYVTGTPDDNGADGDSDGFSDAFETAVGSDPNDKTSTPFDHGGPATAPLDFPSAVLSIKLNFLRGQSDSFQLTGSLPLNAANLPPIDHTVVVDIGGYVAAFSLLINGKSPKNKIASFSVGVSPVNGVSKFSCKISNSDLASLFAGQGATKTAQPNTPIDVLVTVLYNDTGYQSIQHLLFTQSKGKSGKTKAAP